MSGTAGQELLETVVAKLAISETLARYSRGVDRCDLATLKSVFWPDAVVNYGDADQNGWEWCEGVVVALRELERTQHAIGNVLIDLDGPVATAETYCRAYHEVRTPDGNQEFMVGGRYLDRFALRDGAWKIAARQYVMDFNQNGPSTARWSGGLYDGLRVVGARFPEDPLYTAGIAKP